MPIHIFTGRAAKKPNGKGRRVETDEVMRITDCQGGALRTLAHNPVYDDSASASPLGTGTALS